MSDPSNLNMEGSMLAQCLAFSRQMESNKKSFKLEVKLSSGFSFNFNTLDQEESKSRTKEVKKKSPSTLRRNAARKQKFLDKKNTSSANKELSEDSNKCDQCDYQANCKVSLRKHVGKKHLVIPQIDGLEDLRPSEEKSSQTEVQVKHSEAQTESSDSPVIVKWGECGELVLPPGTVILRRKPGATGSELDYPVMSPPATWVFHPTWGLGKHDEEDEEHIFYRFKEDQVHTHTGGRKF
jgi:hypothetical protein